MEPARPVMSPVGSLALAEALAAEGVRYVVSVPDTWMRGFLTVVAADARFHHIAATREDEAVGIVGGLTLAGARAVGAMQNIGALLAAHALFGFAVRYHVPVVLLVSHRGGLDDDRRHHIPKAQVIEPALAALGVAVYHAVRQADVEVVRAAWRWAQMATRPAVVLAHRAVWGTA